MNSRATPRRPSHSRLRMFVSRHVAAVVLGLAAAGAHAGPVRSVGPLVFVDAQTAVVADWVGAELHAVRLPPVAPGPAQPFNLKDVSTPIARALHTQPDRLRFEGMALRPQTGWAYITVMVQRPRAAAAPALVAVSADGKVMVVDLSKARQVSTAIRDVPAADKRLWRDVPQATLTVTDLVFHEGKLYVAGLSNASFASTLRAYDYPFGGTSKTTSVEIYHAVHDQVETRAPIRKMAVVTLDGEPTLLAAYTCTPLVTIPLKELVDGTHVKGKTIAELGWGSSPVGMVAFDAGQGPMVLLANSHKSADLMAIASIAQAAAKPGLSTPIQWPAEPLLGVKAVSIPMAGLAHLADQDKEFLAALRRDESGGAMELVSIRKGAFLRLSDFVNEYDFADYKYPPATQWRGVHRTLRTDEGFSDLAPRD